MNHASGSALQKVTFVLVLFVAAAAGYLVVRERIRARQERAEDMAAAAASAEILSAAVVAPEHAGGPSGKAAFAPLRPRVETNVVRVPSNRFIGVPGPVSNRVAVVRELGGGGSQARVTPAIVVDSPLVVAGGGGVVPGGGRPITGRVVLRGIPPVEKVIALDAACGALQPVPVTTRHYVVGDGGALADVFVYIKNGLTATPLPAGLAMPLLDQINCEYQPYVLGVQTGQGFTVRNSDPILHNVHALAKTVGNRERNVAQPVRGMTTRFVFEKSEVFVQFKCDVHPWMFAYVGVVDHPWFAVTDRNGNFTLPAGLPPGQYTLAAVHRKAGEQTQPITVSADSAPQPFFTFEVPTP